MARSLFTPYPQTEAPLSPPDDYQHIQTSPDMFGGMIGRAEQQAGSQIAQLGTHLTDMYDQIASTNAYTQFQNTANDLMYGNPEQGTKGYLAMTGEEAMHALPGIRAQLDQQIAQIKGGLKTATSQVDFERASRRLQEYTLRQAGSHYIGQQQEWGISTQNGALASGERAIANTYNDDEFFKHQQEDMRSAAVQRAQLQGKNPLEAIDEADSRAVQARLNGALAQRDFQTADRIFKQYGNLLDDKARPVYENHIRTGMTSSVGSALADWALGLGPPPAGTAAPQAGMSVGGAISGAAARYAAPPEQYDVTVSQAASRYGVPKELLTRVLHAESGFNPDAVSPTGARGIAQFITSTANQYGVDRSDPTSSIMGAAHYLSDLRQQKGSWQEALRGYLGSDPWKDASYTGKGAIQTAAALDSGGTTSPQPATSGGNIVAFGDSIAAHLVRKAGVGGHESGKVGAYNPGDTAVSGYNPSQVLTVITNTPDEAVQGKNVVLSTGTSNDPSDKWKGSIPAQIALLKSKGAASVTVMGVGTKYADRNDELAQIAADNGAAFSGPLRKVAGDGIHSSDPKAELAAVQQAMQPGTQAASIAAPDQSPAAVFDKNAPFVKPGVTQSTSFNTKLSPQDETEFRKWVADNHVPFNPDAKGPQDYDMRGFWKGLTTHDPHAETAVNPNDHQLHFSDYWKTPFHHSFSAESQWANPQTAPRWNDKDQLVTPDGRVVFDEKAKAASTAAPDQSAQGVDAGSDAAQPGATGGPQRNRTGLPSLTEQYQRIFDTPGYTAEQRNYAWDKARARYTAMEADAGRSERLLAQADVQRVNQRTNEIYADAFSGHPQITAQQIATDPAFNNNEPRRRQMIELVQKTAEGGRVDPGVSHTTSMQVMSDIAANRITEPGPIIDLYNSGKLNNTDFAFLNKNLADVRTPQGERLSKAIDDLIKAITPQIEHSNPLMNNIDYSGRAQLGMFAYDVRNEVENARRAGKSVEEIAQTILNPHRYVDHPELLTPYRKPLQESLRDQARSLMQQSGTAPTTPAAPAAPVQMKPNPLAAPASSEPVATAPIPPAPSSGVVPRLPGETPADYLKRIGAGLPGTR